MATIASDDFTDTDAVLLQNHTPTGGGTWTKSVGGTGDDIDIRGNEATPSEGSVAVIYYTHSVTPATAEYDVTATLHAAGTSNHALGVTGRAATAAATAYLIWTGDLRWILYRVNAGSSTELGEYVVAPANNDVMKLEIKDATKRLFLNGTQRISSGDNNITAVGKPGLAAYGTSTTYKVDTWLVEEAAAASTRAPPFGAFPLAAMIGR